jgi:CRP-like cAMP-binding protein
MELTREDLTKAMAESPTAAMTVLREMADRLRETNVLLTQRAAKDAVKEVEDTKRAARFRVADVDGDPPFLGVRRGRGRPSSVRSPVFPPAAGNKNSRGALPGK